MPPPSELRLRALRGSICGSSPFVSIRGSIIPPFVPFVLFVVLNVLFVSIRVRSWFYYSPFRAFRAFRAFECFIRVPSCPFVVQLLPLSCLSCVSWFIPTQWTRGRIAARARPRAPSTHYLLLPPSFSLLIRSPLQKVENREKRVESSAWPARLGAPRTATQPCSSEAHCIVSTHYILPSSPSSLLGIYPSCEDIGKEWAFEVIGIQ